MAACEVSKYVRVSFTSSTNNDHSRITSNARIVEILLESTNSYKTDDSFVPNRNIQRNLTVKHWNTGNLSLFADHNFVQQFIPSTCIDWKKSKQQQNISISNCSQMMPCMEGEERFLKLWQFVERGRGNKACHVTHFD